MLCRRPSAGKRLPSRRTCCMVTLPLLLATCLTIYLVGERRPQGPILDFTDISRQNIGHDPIIHDTGNLTLGSAGTHVHLTDDEINRMMNAGNTSIDIPAGQFSNDHYAPLDFNPLPLTAIDVRRCILPNFMVKCSPQSTPEDDRRLGPWVQVAGDPNSGLAGILTALFYRRSPSMTPDAETVLIDLTILGEDESKDESQGWHKIDMNLRFGLFPAQATRYLWYRTQAVQEAIAQGNQLTEIDFIHGSRTRLLPGWSRLGVVNPGDHSLEDLEANAEKTIENKTEVGLIETYLETWFSDLDIAAILIGRRRPIPSPVKPILSFSKDGRFRILQVADLHLSTGDGHCRDVPPHPIARKGKDPDNVANDPCEGDIDSLHFAQRVIDREKPDLLVFSGDQINGQGTSWDAGTAMMKVASIALDNNLPWAMVLGNHDRERGNLDGNALFKFASQLEGFVGETGPSRIDGEGNYRLPVFGPADSELSLEPRAHLWFLDSHAGSPSIVYPGYDWIKPSQIDWFAREAAMLPEMPELGSGMRDAADRGERERLQSFKEAGGNMTILFDNVKSLTADATRALQNFAEDPAAAALAAPPGIAIPRAPPTSGRKPNSIVFQHIPLPQYKSDPDYDDATKQEMYVGSRLEGYGAPLWDSGFFDALKRPEIKAVACGHDHITDFAKRVEGIWLLFDGGQSYVGYGKEGFHRRMRVFDLSLFGDRIETWKRLADESLTMLDRMVIAQ